VLQDVDQLSEWIANEEPAYAPRFARRAVFDRDTRLSDPPSDITLSWSVIFELEP
jgi:hypothetical protein